jgi:deoxyribonuclease V
MENSAMHAWDISPAQARALQNEMAGFVDRSQRKARLRKVAGIDVSISRFSHSGRAAVVVLSYPSLELIDCTIFEGAIEFPYIPGLLSFREAPLITRAWALLKTSPDVALVDGQGIAHPRRLGVASHLGLLLGVPTVGCAKSRLIGSHGAVPYEAGGHALLRDGDEVIGAVVRTKRGINPLYVSIGHRINLPGAIDVVLNCCRGYRLPEPARMAHMAAGGHLPGKTKIMTRK